MTGRVRTVVGLLLAGAVAGGGLLLSGHSAVVADDAKVGILRHDGTRGRQINGPTNAELRQILTQGRASALTTPSPLRSMLPAVQRSTRMHIAVVDRHGRLLALHSMPDAWEGSMDIAKARTAAFFSSNQNALTSRIIGLLSQPHMPGGGQEEGTGPAGPLWGIWASNQVGISGNPLFRNGIITFPGGVPLYRDDNFLIGGVGVSGDAVDEDEAVAFAAAAGFAPGPTVAQLGFD
jgi:uncharacterized protein GlcG (DUF336 family)